MEDLTGRQLNGYQIVGPLGEGGMAAVYKAFQPGVDRYVALKILPRQLAADPQFVGRFQQEAQLLANLQHPRILPVFDYGEADGFTYIVMPLVTSGTLDRLLTGTPLPLPQVEKIISQVADALDYAHGQGLIHRDIKPSNILVDERGNCLLTDFGIAKILEGTSRFTQTGGIIGTPAYMSPEQGKGLPVDERSDIYSLGIILYEMVTGRVPFQAETPIAIVYKHIEDPLPLPRSNNPSLPEGVERVILKTLAKQPEDRYRTAGEMVQALQSAAAAGSADDTFIDPRPTPGPARGTSSWPKGFIAIVGVASLLGVAAIICLAALLSGRLPFGQEAGTPTESLPSVATSLPEEIPSPTPSIAPSATQEPTATSLPTAVPTTPPTATPLILVVTATVESSPTASPLPPEAGEACPLAIGQAVVVQENARLWSQPNVSNAAVVAELAPGSTAYIVAGPIWGRIRTDVDISGWWWQLATEPAGSPLGWLWEERIEACAE